MTLSATPLSATVRSILDAFDAARRASPRLPAIEIAQRLGISEGELQAARLGRDVVTLPLPPAELAGRLHTLGRVKALTRSSAAVLEQSGRYPVAGEASAGLLLDPGGLDLRLHLQRWHWACLIQDELPGADGTPARRHSLQVFDRHGRALHKAFSLAPELPDGWHALAAGADTRAPCFTGLSPAASRPLPEAPGLAHDWGRMRDVHQFFTLLRRHGLERHEANALMEGRFTHRLPAGMIEAALVRAAERRLPLMLFVASPGGVQIRSGTLPAPERRGGWLNLFGSDFTLHLKDDAIADAWVVRKPNRDGGVTSLEAFGADGELLLQLYARRREGEPERADWRWLLAELAGREVAA